jgi:hypothetical protein
MSASRMRVVILSDSDDVARHPDLAPAGHGRNMTDLIEIFAARGDLAHLALLLWALTASAIAWFALRELAAASRRFDDFVRELARFNNTFGER